MGVNGDLAGGAMSDFFLHGGAFEVTRSQVVRNVEEDRFRSQVNIDLVI